LRVVDGVANPQPYVCGSSTPVGGASADVQAFTLGPEEAEDLYRLGAGVARTSAGRGVGLEPAGPAGQGYEGHAVAADRTGVDARVAGRRRVDELIQRDLVGLGQQEQEFQGGSALTGL
jgi:hypothetical protein